MSASRGDIACLLVFSSFIAALARRPFSSSTGGQRPPDDSSSTGEHSVPVSPTGSQTGAVDTATPTFLVLLGLALVCLCCCYCRRRLIDLRDEAEDAAEDAADRRQAQAPVPAQVQPPAQAQAHVPVVAAGDQDSPPGEGKQEQSEAGSSLAHQESSIELAERHDIKQAHEESGHAQPHPNALFTHQDEQPPGTPSQDQSNEPGTPRHD